MIKLNNISKSYDHTKALDHFSLDIKEGEFWGLIGPNGSGKTTLYKCIMGLLTADEGDIHIHGMDNRKKTEAVKRMIGYSPEPPVLYDYLTAVEYLEFIGKMNGMSGNDLKANIDRLLVTFELQEKFKDPIADFSHGMRKKVSLAAALLKSPPILLLDEPTGGLDAESIFKLKQHLLGLRQQGCTMLLSSHIIDTVEKLCTHVAIISHGGIVLKEKLENILQSLQPGETLETFFMDHLPSRS